MIPLRRAITLLKVSVSGYYKWLLSDKEHKNGVIHSDIEVLIAVKDVIKDSNYIICFKLQLNKSSRSQID